MIEKEVVEKILEGEFSRELAGSFAKKLRSRHIVRRVGTTRSTSTVHRWMEEKCDNTPGCWTWGDGSCTVVDIREK